MSVASSLHLQDLPPAAARFCLEVRAALGGLLDTAALAASLSDTPSRMDNMGRADSMDSMDRAGKARSAGKADSPDRTNKEGNADRAEGADSPSEASVLPSLAPSPKSLPRMVIAFSGGADSTALALALHVLGVPCSLAHLDHQLRSESATEAQSAQAFAQHLGIPCRIQRVDVAALAQDQGLGLEEAGRAARYAFFEQVRCEHEALWIATGHHLDDLCEDVLLRLTRGTGWPSLAGMPALDTSRRLIRPLLHLRREQIEAFLHTLGYSWMEDASNASLAFRRNRIRHTVLPLLHAENPSFSRSIHTLWQLAQDDAQYWQSILEPVLEQAVQTDSATLLLPRGAFIRLPRAARLRVYTALIRRFGKGQPHADTLFRLDRCCTSTRARKVLQLFGNVTIISDANGLTLCHTPRRTVQGQ